MTLSKGDLNKISTLIDERLDIRFEAHKQDILGEIDNKLSQLKSDFYDKIDPILTEVVTAREERTLYEDRLEKLEEIHPKGKHQLTT